MALRVELAGTIGVEVDGVRLAARGLGRLGPPALAYLVAERHRPVRRDELAELLWADDPPISWEQLVRGVISTLRGLLRDAGLPATEVLTTDLGCYQLHLPVGTVVDIEAAADGVANAGALLAAGNVEAALAEATAAVSVASRQFLPGLAGAWVERRQAETRELHLRALEAVAACATAGAQWATAVAAAEDAIALEPYRESAYRLLVAAHAASGSRGEALRAYERCRRQLAAELGVGPSPSTEALYVSLLGVEPPTTTSAAVPLPGPLVASPGTVLAGREAETEQLLAALRRSQVDGRQVFLVAGEPGIGKTALVGGFGAAALAQGAHVLYGRCDEDLGVAYQPFAEALDGYLDGCALAELHAHVATHGGELSRVTPALARRLSDTPPPAATDPEVDRYRLFQAVGALLTAASAVRPVVLVLDDLHWASNETLLLLRHLVRSGQPAGLLVVGTYRHTEVVSSHPLAATLADLRREAVVERLVLEGLDEAGVAAIVTRAGPRLADDDRAALTRAVHAHTAGNPFFAGELVRHLIETGSLYRRTGSWSYYDGRGEVDVPQGVREVVSRRLQRLSESANRALRLASVVGSEFTLDLLEQVAGPADAAGVLDAIDEAVVGHLVVELGQGRYRFGHDLVRETLRSALSTTRRCRLHRQVAIAVETGPHGPTGPPLAALAHHYAETASADCAAKAADYAMAAAREAIALAAWDEAANRLERGLEVLELQEPPDLERRCDLLLLLAETWMRFFDPRRVLDAATRAVESARQLGSAERLGRASYWILRVGRDRYGHEAAREVAAEALAALGTDEPGLRSRLLALSVEFGPPEARSSMTAEALALARRSQDQGALGVALMVAAGSVRGSPSAQEFLALAEELVAEAPPDGWDGWRNGHFFRGFGRPVIGDRTGFEADMAACARLGTERRFWYFAWVAGMWQATLAMLDGRFDEVEPLANGANGLVESQVEDLYLRQLFRLHVERGDRAALDVAGRLGSRNEIHRSMLSFAVAEWEGIGAHRRTLEAFVDDGLGRMLPERVPVTLCYRAEVAVKLGGVPRALKIYEELSPYRGQMVVGGMGEGCTGAVDRYLGMMASAAGRRDQAEGHFKSALSIEGRLRARPLVARTGYWYGRMLLECGRAGDSPRSYELLAASLETADALGMAGLAAANRRLLDDAYSAPTATA